MTFLSISSSIVGSSCANSTSSATPSPEASAKASPTSKTQPIRLVSDTDELITQFAFTSLAHSARTTPTPQSSTAQLSVFSTTETTSTLSPEEHLLTYCTTMMEQLSKYTTETKQKMPFTAKDFVTMVKIVLEMARFGISDISANGSSTPAFQSFSPAMPLLDDSNSLTKSLFDYIETSSEKTMEEVTKKYGEIQCSARALGYLFSFSATDLYLMTSLCTFLQTQPCFKNSECENMLQEFFETISKKFS